MARSEEAIRSLEDLPGVRIHIQKLSEQETRHGFAEPQLRAQIEQRLRAGKVPILSQEEWQKTPGWPSLSVKLRCYRRNEWDDTTFSLGASLWQRVDWGPERPNHSVMDVTWCTGLLGENGQEWLLSEYPRYLAELVEAFIADFHAAKGK